MMRGKTKNAYARVCVYVRRLKLRALTQTFDNRQQHTTHSYQQQQKQKSNSHFVRRINVKNANSMPLSLFFLLRSPFLPIHSDRIADAATAEIATRSHLSSQKDIMKLEEINEHARSQSRRRTMRRD
jgi:hypothetical protein